MAGNGPSSNSGFGKTKPIEPCQRGPPAQNSKRCRFAKRSQLSLRHKGVGRRADIYGERFSLG